MLNGISWNRQISIKNKLQIYNSILKITAIYGAETWKFNKNLESKVMSMEMDFLRRSDRCSRLEKIRKTVIREKMNIKNSVLNYQDINSSTGMTLCKGWAKKGSLEEF